MNIIKHKYGKRTISLLLAVILVLCPLQVRAADNKPTIEADNKPTIEIGNYIQMGTYGGVPIVWRCVAKDSNGPLMLSDRVLCDYMPMMQKPTKMPKQARTGAIAGEIILVLTTGETATYVLGSIPTLKQEK